ncbi:galactose-binding domain-like protein [Mycotypha africana]|uniref:galactose-binding domain-like protein n=1 Tax=Mycotypha africana TaxID=64632 RepID=UPI0023008320|nr:galactose-binding domain-like protein [Mycotypha africana]KAI8981859.1 galactose-binding domain-like protein [Mycotypha africana]
MGNVLSSSCQRLKTHSLKESGFLEHAEVTSEILNAKIESVSDECCGEAKNLLKKEDTNKDHAIDDEEFPDGWLTKRHESIASVTIKFCSLSKIYGIDIDTTGFVNSCPSNATIELYRVSDQSWQTILSGTVLHVNTHNLFSLKGDDVYSRIRLSVVPAGGIARLRAFGQISPDFSDKSQEHNLASAALGARIVRWTDNHYGNKSNILLDNGRTMSNGWLSPRSRLGVSRNDHQIVQLAHTCKINSILIDTTAFKYNSPTHVYIDACLTKDDDPNYDLYTTWKCLVDRKSIKPNAVTVFKYEDDDSILKDEVFSHVRLCVIPDGGIQQMKVYGTPADESDKKTILLIEPAPSAAASTVEEEETVVKIEEMSDDNLLTTQSTHKKEPNETRQINSHHASNSNAVHHEVPVPPPPPAAATLQQPRFNYISVEKSTSYGNFRPSDQHRRSNRKKRKPLDYTNVTAYHPNIIDPHNYDFHFPPLKKSKSRTSDQTILRQPFNQQEEGEIDD